MQGWMTHSLIFSGRVELIMTVLLGMLQYWIHFYLMPVSVSNELERMFAKFLWRDKMHAWALDKLWKPEEEGGVAIRRIHEINTAAEIKLVWRCYTSDSMWACLDEEAVSSLIISGKKLPLF